MRLLLAILAGLVLGGAIAWWSAREPDRRADDGGRTAAEADREAAPAAATRPVYRWRDAQGVLQITDTPPQGRPYERVTIPTDRNVVPLGVEPAPADGEPRR